MVYEPHARTQILTHMKDSWENCHVKIERGEDNASDDVSVNEWKQIDNKEFHVPEGRCTREC